MLRSTNDLQGYAIRATDGDIGHVEDFYFDDQAWVIRYLIVRTGSWLSNRNVLISPIAIGNPVGTQKVLPISITKEQVKKSPEIDTDKPVSRQHEIQYLGYYGYPYYWGGVGLWGGGIYPAMMVPGYENTPAERKAEQTQAEGERERTEALLHRDDDSHLRDCKAVMTYHIQATDGDIGHVEGLLVDDQTWAIRYLIVNTSNWWMGHQVLIAPQWDREGELARRHGLRERDAASVERRPALRVGGEAEPGARSRPLRTSRPRHLLDSRGET